MDKQNSVGKNANYAIFGFTGMGTTNAKTSATSGKVAVGTKSSKQYSGKPICVEDLVVEKLGGNHQNIIMTDAIRPRKETVFQYVNDVKPNFRKNNLLRGRSLINEY